MTTSDLPKFIEEATNVVLVWFGAQWCGPCAVVEPTLATIVKEFKGELDAYSVDAEAEPDLLKEYDVACLPTILFFENGRKTHRVIGAKTATQLRDAIIEAL